MPVFVFGAYVKADEGSGGRLVEQIVEFPDHAAFADSGAGERGAVVL